MKIAFFINPKIRKFKKIELEIQQHFLSFDFQFFISEYSGHFISLTKKAIDDGCDHIIAIGGDGTLNEVVNGIIHSFPLHNSFDWDKIKAIKIGVLPMGSGNDFIKNLNYRTITELKNLILQQSNHIIDVGKAEFYSKEHQQSTRFFINITNVGIGGEVVVLKEKLPKIFDGSINYFIAITKTIATYQKKKIKVFYNDSIWEGKILNFVIANGKYFGNAIGIAPQAKINDGKFGITTIGNISLLDYFKHLGTAKKCEFIEHPEVTYSETSEILVESLETEKMTIDMDGEFVGYAPVRIFCLKEKLCFIN